MRRGSSRDGRRGFTLIELTISAALMVMVLASAYACLNAGFSAQRLLDPRLEAVQGARVALAMMSADLRSACALSKNAEFVGMKRKMGGVEVGNLDFGTHDYTPARAGEGDYCQTSYYVDYDQREGVLVLWRRRNPRLALDPFSGGTREEILRGVRGLKFEYYDGYEWYDTWGDPDGRGRDQTSQRVESNLTGMPEAVRITLEVAPGWRVGQGVDGVGSDGAAEGGTRLAADDSVLVFRTSARLNRTGGGAALSGGDTIDAGGGGGGGSSPMPGGGSPGGGGPPAFFPGGGG